MRKVLKAISRGVRVPFNRARAFARLREFHAKARSISETVEWAMNFGGRGHMKIRTMQIASEITALASAVAALQPKIILEIGTARGGTLFIWAQLASAKVISCDLDHRTAQKPLLEALPPPGSGCAVLLLTGDSHTAQFKQRVAQALGGEKADFIFIDGDHSEAGVRADYHDYREFARPGGIIAFHDIVAHQPLASNQVYPFWKSLRDTEVTEEFVDHPQQCGFGIGIVRVPL